MFRNCILVLVALCLCGCATEQQAKVEIAEGVVKMPERITNSWAYKVKALVKKGEVRTIQCSTKGGEIKEILRLGEALQRSPVPVEVFVPEGSSCDSAGAILWFRSTYRTARGKIVIHPAGYPETGKVDHEWSVRAANILAQAGASRFLQEKILYGTMKREDEYTLLPSEIKANEVPRP